VRAYGKSDEIIEPYGVYPISQYANNSINDLIKRFVRTYVTMRLDDTISNVPTVLNGLYPLIGLQYNHFPTITPLSGLSDLNRTINPESLVPVGISFTMISLASLVDTRSRGDSINLFDDEQIASYALTQIQNMYSSPVVFTEVTTSPYP
jgi:hypothetical protein